MFSLKVTTCYDFLSLMTIPVDAGRKLNIHKTFRRRPGRLLNVLCTFKLRPVSTGILLQVLSRLQVSCFAYKFVICYFRDGLFYFRNIVILFFSV